MLVKIVFSVFVVNFQHLQRQPDHSDNLRQAQNNISLPSEFSEVAETGSDLAFDAIILHGFSR